MHDGFVHLVSGYADGAGVHDAAHGDDGDVGGAAADVHDHVAGGLFDGQARADGGGHGLFDEEDFAGARAIRGILHGALFHRRDFAGNADDDARMYEDAAIVSLLNEVREHLFGDFEVGDDAVFHGLDGHDVARSAAEHFFGFLADGYDFAGGFIDGDDGRLIDDDAFAGGKDQRVGGAEINGQVGGKQTENRPQVVTVLIHFPRLPERNC